MGGSISRIYRDTRFSNDKSPYKTFISLLKLTAYYQEPKKNMQSFEERFEAATRRADQNLEKMSHTDH